MKHGEDICLRGPSCCFRLSLSSRQRQRMNTTFNLTLVRHGQTKENVEHIVQGQADCPLNEVGLKQAKAVGDALKDVHFTKVYSSDLKRAYVTCQSILDRNNLSFAVDIKESQLLRERSLGIFEKRTSDELKAAAEKENATPWTFVPENGESLNDVIIRADNFISALLVSNIEKEDHVLIVSHGGLIRSLFKLFNDDFKCFKDQKLDFSSFDYRIENTSWSRFRIQMDEKAKIKTIECIEFCNSKHIKHIQQ